MATVYKCPNIGNCEKADKSELIRLPEGSPTVCPECNKGLISVASDTKNIPLWFPITLISMFLLLAVLIGGWFFFKHDKSVPECTPPLVLDNATHTCQSAKAAAVSPCPSPRTFDPISGTCILPLSPASKVETLLRFHGSNSMGVKLLPALAEAFLKQEGYHNIHKTAGSDENEHFVSGEQNGVEKRIEIQSRGTGSAFEDLKNDRCDIGMASRAVKPEEKQALLPVLGDLTSSASEHVLALDGIAIIVHPSNPVRTFTISQLSDIFSGKITDWSLVGGTHGNITLYARDETSGTWDLFNELVLRNKTLATKERFKDSEKLSEAVTHDPSGIGFVGMNYIGSNKVLAIADTGVEARKPTLLTIKTEDYALSRRLFLYTPERITNKNVSKFIDFAVGREAQPVISSAGLVNMDVTPLNQVESDDPRKQSARWKKLTSNAIEIPTHFRFRTNSDELDNRANRDIGRIMYLLSQTAYQNKEVILIGFADASGSAPHNQQLSQKRADIIKKILAEEGITARVTEGLGAEAFVAPNDTDENREKNRRVEIWVR